MKRYTPLLTVLILCVAATPVCGGNLTDRKDIPLTTLISQLSKASHDTVRNVDTVQCDLRVEQAGRLVLSGKLTAYVWPRPDYPTHTGLYGFLDAWRIEVTSWPAMDVMFESPENQKYAESQYGPGAALMYGTEGCWLVAPGGKEAMKFKLDSVSTGFVFGPINPMLCYYYQAVGFTLDNCDFTKTVGHRLRTQLIDGRKCAVYSFRLPAKLAENDTYVAYLDTVTGMPVREEIFLKGKRLGWATYSQYVKFAGSSYTAQKWVVCAETEKPQVATEADFCPLGTHSFLVKEVRLTQKPAGKVWARITFSNWKVVKVEDSFFAPPKGVTRVDP